MGEVTTQPIKTGGGKIHQQQRGMQYQVQQHWRPNSSMSTPPFPRPNISMAVPKSALLSKLEAFLPQMERENQSLAKAISDGEADKFNIEVDETDTEKPVIQMDFALGVMDDKDDDDSDNDSDDNAPKDIQFKSQSPKTSIRLAPPTTVPSRPLIQELN